MATQRYKIRLISEETGVHEFMRRAHNPVEAVTKLLRYLGMDCLYESGFLVTVVPLGDVRK